MTSSILRTLTLLIGVYVIGPVTNMNFADAEEPSRIKSDEHVVFYPTIARMSQSGRTCSVLIHGSIYEPEQNDILRRIAIRKLRDTLGIEPQEPSTELFEQRIGLFLVDGERGKRVGVSMAGQQHVLDESKDDGHFYGVIKLPASALGNPADGGELRYQAITDRRDPRRFEGLSYCLHDEGVSVISDIDDTIKISDVLDKRQLIRNTFFHDFRPVPGMAQLYTGWEKAGATFHYISASPWQLYGPLSDLVRKSGFPGGTMRLRTVNLNDSTVTELVGSSMDYKRAELRTMFASFPKRRFILVGDSGEKDPEIYGEVARRHRDQVLGIYIRNVSGESRDDPRFRDAFKEIDPETWRLFDNPGELPEEVGG